MFLSVVLDYPGSVVKLARVTGSEILEAIFMLCVCVCLCVLLISMEEYWEAHERIKTLEPLLFCLLVPELTPGWASSSHSSALTSPCDDKIPTQGIQAIHLLHVAEAFTSGVGIDRMMLDLDKFVSDFVYLPPHLNPSELYSYYKTNWLKEIRFMVLTKCYVQSCAHTHFSNSTILCNFNPITYQWHYLRLKHSYCLFANHVSEEIHQFHFLLVKSLNST